MLKIILTYIIKNSIKKLLVQTINFGNFFKEFVLIGKS
jgi:hypothetical protein